MSSRFSSSVEYVGDSRDPEILYYNATIVNNTTDDVRGGKAVLDPPIRFNETRDTALIRDASRYQFSIVRFVVNGGNKDLPLFIPQIQSYTGQTDPNLTEYGVGLTANIPPTGTATTNWFAAPPVTYVSYIPETNNPILAPVPLPPSSPNYVGVYNLTTLYQPGQIVYFNNDDKYYSYNAPIYSSPTPPRVQLNPTITVPPTPDPTNTLYWTVTSSELGRPQSLASKYYWVYTYDWWLTLVNTALDNANLALWQTYSNSAPFVGVNPAPTGSTAYATFDAWKVVYPSPIMVYNPVTLLFSIYFPASYALQKTASTPPAPQFQLYFNVNMEGLFSNFLNNYYNDGFGISPVYPPATVVPVPDGYANAIICQVQGLGQNIILPASLPVPLPYVGNWIVMVQNYLSTSTLWSPIDSIVFTSSLLPVQNEASAPPNVLGSKNIGFSAATSQSAFTPTITDVALDLSNDPSGYRKMIYYAPTSEYRMSDFQNSRFDIRNIDIQVFWRNRLDNQLYPVSMFNLSSVSIKLMFRKKALLVTTSESY